MTLIKKTRCWLRLRATIKFSSVPIRSKPEDLTEKMKDACEPDRQTGFPEGGYAGEVRLGGRSG